MYEAKYYPLEKNLTYFWKNSLMFSSRQKQKSIFLNHKNICFFNLFRKTYEVSFSVALANETYDVMWGWEISN